jgi:dTDP-L-rhamnose 4-epimerase
LENLAMPLRVLITGGAGFIGTHLTRRLLKEGCEVTILDNFNPQIHKVEALSSDVTGRVELIKADVTDSPALEAAIDGQDVVVHLAAETGTGQSMYAVTRYERTNGLGTAVLLDVLVNSRRRTVSKLIVASSRAIYGEGKYRCAVHGVVYPQGRLTDDMSRGQFEPVCPVCRSVCTVLPTDEATPANPSSFYGLGKYMQERSVLLFAKAMGISGFALRYQNVYGPGQSLQNPYTGILAIFSNLARQSRNIEIFEDGEESRDFVYIDDIVDATWRCIEPDRAGLEVFNVGSGNATSVIEVARSIVTYFQSDSQLRVSGAFRTGDIRHNVAETSLAKSVLGFEPKTQFADGLTRFLEWAIASGATSNSGYQDSINELTARGLMGGSL